MDLIGLFFDHLPLLFLLAGLGALAGLLSGLMGIGGGIVLVPGLYYSLKVLGFDPAHIMHVAVGTSLAIMAPTGFTSARAHYRRGAVDIDIVKKMGPGILAGVALGTAAAGYFSGMGLKTFFAFTLFALALLMIGNPARYSLFDGLPRQPFAALAAAVIGFISTLMGIGGASMNVPFMAWCRVPMHRAVGTAAAQGLFISIPGLLGFIVIGWGMAGLPPLSAGYVNLIAAAVIIPFSVMMAPFGARLAHALPVERLRHIFAGMIMLIACRMLWEVFYG